MKQTIVRVTEEQYEYLREMSYKNKISMSECVRQIINDCKYGNFKFNPKNKMGTNELRKV